MLDASELYETPWWCVTRLMDRIGRRLLGHCYPARPVMLEHACGRGALANAVDSWTISQAEIRSPHWYGCDTDLESAELTNGQGFWDVTIGDFTDPVTPTEVARRRAKEIRTARQGSWLRDWQKDRLFDVAITNPPFSKALEMVQSAMVLAPVVIQLSRLSWLGTEERSGWLREHTPSIYALPNRPSFKGNGRTDSANYAWLVWGLDEQPTVDILDCTPVDERTREHRP
jgi:hypothetical protein